MLNINVTLNLLLTNDSLVTKYMSLLSFKIKNKTETAKWENNHRISSFSASAAQ